MSYTLTRWLMSITFAILALVAINALVTTSPVQGRPAADLINCAGSIQACIDAANDGDTILIAAGRYTESLTLSKPVSLTGENRDTTIIHAIAGQRVLTVTGATISTSVVISGLTFTGGSADYGGGILITDTAQPLILATIFVDNSASGNGGGIYAQSDLTLLDSAIISNTSTEFGGGVFAAQSLTVTNGEFIGNSTTGTWPAYFPYGGGIYAQTNVFVANSRFINNTSRQGGGLVSIGSMLTLIDTDFIANAGGGVIAGNISNSSEVRINGGSFSNNTSYSALSVYGSLDVTGTQFLSNELGGVYTGRGPVTIINARFEGNSGGWTGGGLYFDGSSSGTTPSLVLSNTEFIRNSPGVEANAAQVTIVKSRFESNYSSGGGAALWVDGTYPPVVMIDSVVVSNVAQGGLSFGGAVTFNGAVHVLRGRFENNSSDAAFGGGLNANPAYLTDTQFISNSSPVGGGIFGDAYIYGGRFERNTSELGGAMAGGDFYLSGTVIVGNTASDNGGGISAVGTTTLINVRMENNQSTTGGGGGVQTNRLIITDSQILSNTAALGGGAIVFEEGRVVNTVFASNRAITNGAVIAIDAPGSLDLLYTTIADSVVNPQSAIAVLNGTLHLTNTIIASHTIGISNTGGMVYEDYNLFFGNVTNTVGVITDGGHSLVGDPKFVDPLNGDYHLQFGSAALDHGVDAGVYVDLDGNPRPVGAGFDIGAYEYQLIKVLYLPVIYKH